MIWRRFITGPTARSRPCWTAWFRMGFVEAKRQGNVYQYTPKVHRRSVVARAVDDLFDRVLAGSLTPMLDRLIESRRLSPTEIDGLREMLDQYSDEPEQDR